MPAKKRKLRMADLVGTVYVAKEWKRPFYYPEELEEVMLQREKHVPKVSRRKLHSVFDVLPSVVHG